MENTVVFTISKCCKGFNITSKAANLYNKHGVPADKLFDSMQELTDTFNNVFGKAILFEVD